MDKTPNKVYGKQINCINFIQCPLCYGCRNYNSKDPDCIYCIQNKKNNICDINKHKSDLLGRFISVTNITIKDKLKFKSGGDIHD